ncbi:hypothetical protein AAKU52_000019 [Pedobacter sp. CG_S7]|uniref:hypothetical protein n=1 Tax=Pedobacter sp. CG_S7 TaxID=3143930 RepID=UPI003394849F
MKDYKVKKIEEIKLECTSPLSGMFKLSPFVWKENGVYNIMLRAVNPSEDATQKLQGLITEPQKMDFILI